MPIPKELALTPEQLDEMMSTSKTMRIATQGPGDRINLTPLWFGWAGGKVYTFCRAQKVVNLRRSPNATVVVDRSEVYAELQGAMLQGRATVLEDEAAERADSHLEEARLQMGAKYSPAVASGDEPPRNASSARGRTGRWVVLEPDRIASWDNTKLGRS